MKLYKLINFFQIWDILKSENIFWIHRNFEIQETFLKLINIFSNLRAFYKFMNIFEVRKTFSKILSTSSKLSNIFRKIEYILIGNQSK